MVPTRDRARRERSSFIAEREINNMIAGTCSHRVSVAGSNNRVCSDDTCSSDDNMQRWQQCWHAAAMMTLSCDDVGVQRQQQWEEEMIFGFRRGGKECAWKKRNGV